MSELDGEKIERLLFEEGFEFERKLDDDLVHVLKIYGSGAEITLSELWEEGDNWYVDPFSLVLIGKFGGTFVDLVDAAFPTYDEESLVGRIAACVLEELETKAEAKQKII